MNLLRLLEYQTTHDTQDVCLVRAVVRRDDLERLASGAAFPDDSGMRERKPFLRDRQRPGHLPPPSPAEHGPNRADQDSVSFRQPGMWFALDGVLFADSLNCFWCQEALPAAHAIFGGRIEHIVLMSPESQVGRVHAMADIAGMKHMQSSRDRSVNELPGQAMRRFRAPSQAAIREHMDGEAPIARSGQLLSEPQPASTLGLAYLSPESFGVAIEKE